MFVFNLIFWVSTTTGQVVTNVFDIILVKKIRLLQSEHGRLNDLFKLAKEAESVSLKPKDVEPDLVKY